MSQRVLALAALVVWGCGSSEAPPAPPAREPIVRPVDLTVVKRHSGQANPRAAVVEISPTEIALEGTRLVQLQGGRIPEAAIHNGALNDLLLQASGLASRGVLVKMHTLTRYDVMLQVMRALASVPNVGFAVRSGMTPNTGGLTVERFEVREPSNDPVDFPAPYGHEWSELVALWEEMYSRCQGEGGYECDPKPERIAQGGKVEIGLFTQQEAFVLDFRRYGTDDPPPPPVEWMPPQAGTDDEDREMRHPPPATQASFFFLRAATQAQESPIALAIRAMCQAQACGARVTAPPATAAGQILILIGAAFPDGFAPPRIVLETGGR